MVMKQAAKKFVGVAAIVLLSSGVGGFTAYKLLSNQQEASATFSELFQQNPDNMRLAALTATNAQPVDLTQAAETSVHAVVHIRSTQISSLVTRADRNARFRHSLVWATVRASSSRKTAIS